MPIWTFLEKGYCCASALTSWSGEKSLKWSFAS